MEEAEAPSRQPVKVIRQLASCNKSARDRALKLLRTWLAGQPEVSDEEMRKIWKGLFFCVWHADKAPVQVALVDLLSSFLLALDLPLACRFFSVFLSTMRREWSAIDAHRLDKFYLLIRRFMHSFFKLMKKNCWDSELSSRLMTILLESTFLANDKLTGNGVNYHIASVFLQELRTFLPLGSDVLNLLFPPLLTVMQKSTDKVLLTKIKSGVFDLLLKTGTTFLEAKKSQRVVDYCDDVCVFGLIALSMGFSAQFYETGSSPECVQGNRKVLFSLHEGFLKLEKDLESTGIEISIHGGAKYNQGNCGNDDDDAPPLVPLSTYEETVSESTRKRSSKKKKSKKGGSGHGKGVKSSCMSHVQDMTVTTLADEGNENGITTKREDSTHQLLDEGNSISFTESAISNLQKQFEMVAAEVGMGDDGTNACLSPEIQAIRAVPKKRKRANKNRQESIAKDDDTVKKAEKSAKRVRFSMKNNLVWKPHSPLPPQSLRLPPSVTPRGSALKKGVPPGPIREMSPVTKKVKRANSVKKCRKRIKGVKKFKPFSL